MTDSTNNHSEETKKLSEKEELRRQGDLVIQGFKHLADTTNSSLQKDYQRERSITITSVKTKVSVDQPELKKGLLVQLQTSLLPQLQQHVITISQLTNPSDLRKEPASSFKRMLEIQSDLTTILDQISHATDTICSEQLYLSHPSVRRNDQYLNELKPYKLEGLHHRLTTFFLQELYNVFDSSYQTIQQLEFSTKKYNDRIDLTDARDTMIEAVDECLECIELALDWLKGSEFDNVQEDWRYEKCGINETLQKVLSLIDPTTSLSKKKRRLKEPLSRPVVKLAKSVVPVIKLCRLFFNKLSARGMNRRRLPPFTTMCSYQLENIGALAGHTGAELGRILHLLQEADTIVDEDTRYALTKAVGALETQFQTPFLLILLHFVPIIPDTDGHPVQDYYKKWFAVWNTQFNLAIINLLDAIKEYEGN
ncbi:hypothetical protein PGTUg99_012829 [Puccinia graminis f. sp. tritici]|uniref:Uncharacterized protein n=1 Tax=Puccinia graminis f. sp. tritici TaxID=56615 RepID=A0A5B0LLF9_PUCGR|nr:hypothetical protein PGTUg99_012829 [Puccinia graminis f. sp. tritici]